MLSSRLIGSRVETLEESLSIETHVVAALASPGEQSVDASARVDRFARRVVVGIGRTTSGRLPRVHVDQLSYSYINAKKGTKYVQTKLYRYKHEKFDVVSRVDGKIVVAAFPDGDKAVSKNNLQKFLDAVK